MFFGKFEGWFDESNYSRKNPM